MVLILGIPAAVILFVSAFADLYLGMRARDRSPFTGAAMLLCIACALPGLLGIVAALRSAAAAVIFAAAAAGLALTSGRHGAAGEIITETRAAFGRLGSRIRSLGRRAAALAPRDGSEDTERIPVEAVAEAVATRAIPALREDPALGEALAPQDVAEAAGSVGVPAPWAAVASWIASFEADDEKAEITFIMGNAAGQLAVAQAWTAHADHLLNGVGVDPSIAAGVVEYGGVFAESAGMAALIVRRIYAVYQQIREWVSAGGKLPHKARQWFGDGNAA